MVKVRFRPNNHSRMLFFGGVGTRGGSRGKWLYGRISADIASNGKSVGEGIPVRLDHSGWYDGLEALTPGKGYHPRHGRILVHLLKTVGTPVASNLVDVVRHVFRRWQLSGTTGDDRRNKGNDVHGGTVGRAEREGQTVSLEIVRRVYENKRHLFKRVRYRAAGLYCWSGQGGQTLRTAETGLSSTFTASLVIVRPQPKPSKYATVANEYLIVYESRDQTNTCEGGEPHVPSRTANCQSYLLSFMLFFICLIDGESDVQPSSQVTHIGCASSPPSR
jgi:hypothetical protein